MPSKPAIEALKKALAESTTGEWVQDNGTYVDVRGVNADWTRIAEIDSSSDDAIFIALAHNSLPALIGYVERLEAALKPFADALDAIPEGLRSTLRIWDGEDGIIHLPISTDTLEAARAALADSGEPESEG